MKIEKILDIRFLVPPSLAIFFIFLFSPLDFIRLIVKWKDVSWIVGATSIFGLGFLISSVTELIVNLWDLRISKCKEIYEKIKSLNGIFINNKGEKDALELASWLVLDETDTKKSGQMRQISDQIHKRWNMAMANFNSFVAIAFAFITVSILLHYEKIVALPDCLWSTLYLISAFIFLIIFWFNGQRARKSVLIMDRILANRLLVSESEDNKK